jgi:hypothetical protein
MMSDRGPKALRLTAMDREGLHVMSACIQDSLTRISQIAFQRRERRFVLTANRYMWEHDREAGAAGQGDDLHYRIRTGVHFNGVLGVQSQGLMQQNLDGLMALLSVEVEGDDDDSGEGAGNLFLTLVFAAGARIRLEVECIDCVLTDMDEPWATRSRPDHDLDPTETEGPSANPR